MVLLDVRPSLAAPQVALTKRRGNFAVDISLGGFPIRILVESSELRDAILDQFSSYTAPAWSTPDLELRVQPTNEPHFLPLNEGRVQIKWNLIPGGLQFTSNFELATLDLESGQGTVWLSRNGNLENLLRVYLAYRCLQEGGLVMHASAVVWGGKAHVFFGPSGAGKTTIATIAAGMGVPILGEDIVLIRRVGRSYWVHSLPFGSLRKISDAQSRSAPLAGMYRLRKGPQPQILPLPGVRRIAGMVTAIPFIHLNRDMSLAAMTICENIIAAVPVQEIWFRADQSVQAVLPDNVTETVGDRPLSQSFASVI